MENKGDLGNGNITTQLIEKVLQWQNNVSREPGKGMIAKLYAVGRNLYYAFMRNTNDKKLGSKALYRRLDSGYTNYLIWADDYKAQDGGLDVLLENSHQLRKFTILLLVDICAILQKLCSVHMFASSDTNLANLNQYASNLIKEASLDTEDDNTGGYIELANAQTLENVTEALLAEIENLLDLGPRLEDPVLDSPIGEHPIFSRVPDPWNPIQFFSNRVLSKFPKCDSDLAVALGKANWHAFQRIASKQADTPVDENRAQTVGNAITEFKDSGLGTSVASTNNYAATVISYRRDGEKRASIPPLPSNIEEGQLFPCIACGKEIEKRDMRTWKRHLLADLRPWICCQTSCPCERMAFTTREDWLEHLARGHALHPEWDDKTCPLCREVVPSGGFAMISHVAYHLEEISLAVFSCDPGHDGETDASMSSQGSLQGLMSDPDIMESFNASNHDPPSPSAMDVVNDKPTTEPGRFRGNRSTPVWFCCECGNGPMVVETTWWCVFCSDHERCTDCVVNSQTF
ncbi:uncharacterized protein GGS22DRAFT_152372 [Annulohypoxylon maeteangense]|uniref:uncharacterized protein n=1 Tax=Annulohypoxylon maeteangense TaxID=1927788 RepID=UPI002007A397|nr:uncharacterized protein GGS22DRAFT_152372 [Annulohypoxylon maeteangense]KAI0888800.1 hypothetical protein GGS22DRAFT_152372 [Annulohypoxylon maeteangense]